MLEFRISYALLQSVVEIIKMKKLILALLFLVVLSSPSYAVTRYWVGGGSSGNWNATGNTNWGSASGTRDNQAVPTASEDVVFDDHSNGNTPCTVTAAAACKTLTFTGGTGWTNTFTVNSSQAITVSGDVTLNSAMTYAGAGTLTMGTAGSVLDTNTKTITGGFTIGSNSVTLAENIDVNGLFNQASGDSGALTAAAPVNANFGGGMTVSRKTTLTNVTIILDGTGTWGGTTTNGRYLDGNVTINAGAGTITMSSPSWGGGTLTYTDGTISSGTTTFSLNETGTFAGEFPTTAFYNLAVTAASTLTIDHALYVTNNLALAASLTMSGDYAFDPANISTSATSTLTIVRPITVPGTVS